MALLAVACAAIGLAPARFAPAVERAAGIAARGALPKETLADLGSLGAVGLAACALVLGLAACALLLLLKTRAAPLDTGPTWDCGYAAPGPRMQYTASSFARGPVGFFRWVLLPHAKAFPVDRLFPRSARFESHVPDTVLDRAVLPLFRIGAFLASRGHVLQQGRIQLYLLYVGATLVALLFRV